MARPRKKSLSTRKLLTDAAFRAIHRDGFQAAGLSTILAETGLTKGALYHHFKSKLDLGYAVVEGPLRDYVNDWWLKPLDGKDDPLQALAGVIAQRLRKDVPAMLKLGCPLNNLAQEMAPVDEGFRNHIEILYRDWRRGLAKALRQGQHAGSVDTSIEVDATAAFIIAALQGAFGQAKNAQDLGVFRQCLAGLNEYLNSLRP
jgi:AcrR family transcriptional regulator